MFTEKSDDNFTVVQEGIAIKTQVHGQKTLLAEFRLKKGNTLPTHSHPHEQTGYLVSGRLGVRTADGTEFEAGPGDVNWLPPGHDAWVVGDEAVEAIDWGGAHVWGRAAD